MIADRVAADPSLAQRAALLQSIPGIGPLVAVTILVETGDLTRFRTTDQLGAYAGLTPRVRQSAHTVHHGHISKTGPPLLRWVPTQAAWSVCRRGQPFRWPELPAVTVAARRVFDSVKAACEPCIHHTAARVRE